MKQAPRSILAIISLILAACGGKEPPPAQTPSAPAPVKSAPAPTASAEQPKPPKQEERMDVDFVEAKVRPQPKKLPRVRVDVPGFNQYIPASLVKVTRVRYKIANWGLMPEGSYVQFILDNQPYKPVEDPKTKVKLEELNGGKPLADGEHMLAVYVAMKNHQSIKGTGAIAVRRFWVGKRTKDAFNPSKDPMLILGSPFGRYEGDSGDEILVDWYLLSADMSKEAYSVEVILKGPGIKKEGIRRVISEWHPWLVLSAHDGDYTIEANLINPNGDTLTNAWNSTKRTFTVKH